jgi:hypothetical protein
MISLSIPSTSVRCLVVPTLARLASRALAIDEDYAHLSEFDEAKVVAVYPAAVGRWADPSSNLTALLDAMFTHLHDAEAAEDAEDYAAAISFYAEALRALAAAIPLQEQVDAQAATLLRQKFGVFSALRTQLIAEKQVRRLPWEAAEVATSLWLWK